MLSCNFHIKTDNPQYQLEYFDLEEKLWKKLSNASTLPHIASLVVAEKKLYAVVGRSLYARGSQGADFNPASVKEFYEYDTKQNKWIKLPSMLKSHEIKAFQVLYMDGFIYVIGGQLYSGAVERFNIADQCWEELPSLPSYYSWTSAIAYDGNILVYGVKNIDESPHEILEYNPSTNMWQVVLSEQVPADMIMILMVKPVLFVYGDQAYRVMYKRAWPADAYDPTGSIDIPVVNKLDRHIDGRIAIGEEVTQNVRIANIKGAFLLQDQVFISTKGFILLTDVKMNHDADDTGLTVAQKWRRFLFTLLQAIVAISSTSRLTRKN